MKIQFRGTEIGFAKRHDFWKVVENDGWEKDTFDALDYYIQPGKTFIDIGAWNGVLSIYASKLGAKVFSVEPDKIAYEELVANLQENTDVDFPVVAQNVAIFDRTGTTYLNSMTEDGLGNSESSLVDRGVIKKSQKVSTYTLRQYLMMNHVEKNEICLIKIDIEGGEAMIIGNDLAKTLKDYGNPPIHISFHPSWFPHKENSVKSIWSQMSKDYDFISINQQSKIDEEQFINAMNTTYDHAFILSPRA